MKYISLFFIVIIPCFLYAQPTHLSVPFQDISGDVYDYALTGGLNNPQFSEIDLDGDGDQDLVYFDREGYVVVPFLNGGTANTVDYTYAPEYAYRFPKEERWMLLRDYNCDMLEDIFCYKRDATGAISITVYEASRDAQNKVVFTQIIDIIRFHLKGQTQLSNLFNSTIDLPAVDDIDGDGDMDILNFNSAGGYVDMYKNESQEKGFGCDSLLYVLNDNCWGRMYESGVSEVIDLSPRIDSCSNYAGWFPIKSARHSGSTLLTLDMDNNGTKELMLGDLSFTNLNLLTNGGNVDTAFMTSQETFFPQSSLSANIDIFPAAFYIDVNNDGAKDLLAAPNIGGINSVDDKNWYYKNTGTANFPAFTYQVNDFLVDEMIDKGTGSAPAFVDYNGDGLLDIVVGNNYTFINNLTQESSLSLYENIGTATQPSYRLVDADFATIKQYNQRRLVPTFGDLDNDGDQDMILGLESGELIYVANIGTATVPNFLNISANYAGIDIGQNSTPQLVDADRDGDLDLIIGERNGNTNYFENTGTASAPTFSNTETSATFGFIDTKLPGYLKGNSAPHLVDVNGDYHLFMGNEVGEMWQYNNIDGNLLGTFTRVNGVLDSVDQGSESILAIANINGGASLEFLVGNKRGGLGLYTESLISSIETIEANQNSLTIFPNPTAGTIKISFSDAINEEVVVQVTNLLGQVVINQKRWMDKGTELNLQQLSIGSYIVTVQTKKGIYVEKVVKQ